MIISRYLTRQILQVTAATTFILLAVVVLGRFLKYLGQASQGEIDPAILALLMTYRIPEFIQLILPLALLLSISAGLWPNVCRQRDDGVVCLWFEHAALAGNDLYFISTGSARRGHTLFHAHANGAGEHRQIAGSAKRTE